MVRVLGGIGTGIGIKVWGGYGLLLKVKRLIKSVLVGQSGRYLRRRGTRGDMFPAAGGEKKKYGGYGCMERGSGMAG